MRPSALEVRSHSYWMRRALRLARRYIAAAWPNPAVAACLVRDGKLLAEGVHRGQGLPHAEREALEILVASGGEATGATLYVTLEPCNHLARTPPCTDAIVEAGISRVVYAVTDSNPAVVGGGARSLRQRGIDVIYGPHTHLAWEMNHRFFESRGGSEPHVTLKLALSADGRLARAAGPLPEVERRLTGPAAWRRVHRLRADSSAVLVGRRTALYDSPRLSARGVDSARQPCPVVLDTESRLEAAVLPARCLVLTAVDAPALAPGCERVACERGDRGLAWSSILGRLRERNLDSVLVEGGAQVASSLLCEHAPHRIHLFMAPRFVGGGGASLSYFPGPETAYDTYLWTRRGEDVEWVLRRRGLPAPETNRDRRG